MALALIALLAPAYTLTSSPIVSRSAVFRHAPVVAASPELKVTGLDVTVTDAMKEYAEGKLDKPLDRFGEMINGAVDLHLKVEHRSLHDAEHHGKEAHIAELTATCTDKFVIRATAESESMYSSLDELADMVTRKLRKHKEKKMDVKQERRRDDKLEVVEALVDADDDDE